MAELNLRLRIPGGKDRVVPVIHNEFTLGRSLQCDLHLPFPGVSRYHARLLREGSGWLIEDMGSKNGTRVNMQIISAPTTIQPDDIILLGNACIIATFAESPPIPVPPPPPIFGERKSGFTTILRRAEDLQHQWIQADDREEDKLVSQEKAIERLKDLVEIAKGLNSAESIEAIFSQVQTVVFRYIASIERLALLVDVSSNGELKLLDAATRHSTHQRHLAPDGSWISRSICQRVFVEKVAMQIADTQEDEGLAEEESILFKGIRSAMAVPLWNETQVVGVLYADAHISSSQWIRHGEEDLSFFSALANLVAASVQRWLLEQKLRNEEKLRHRLERYHSPAVVQQMIAGGTFEDGGDRLAPIDGDISILFADIVGFTALSERLTPVEIAELLNGFFEEMLQEVFAVGGTLDKFIGDCIMAFFGAPEPQTDHAWRAVKAASGMLDRLDRLNADQILSEPLQLRIAINSGRAVVGDVGSSKRVDYTVLGPTINLAARMESICPPGECIVSKATYELLDCPLGWRAMGEYQFKGIKRPVPIYQTQRREQLLVPAGS